MSQSQADTNPWQKEEEENAREAYKPALSPTRDVITMVINPYKPSVPFV